MLDNEAAHWFVYYLSSIPGQINILSTWGSEQWGIPLLYNRIDVRDWDLFINNINQDVEPTVNTELFEILFLNSEKAVSLRSDEIEDVLTKKQVQEEIKKELFVYTPGRVKIYSVFPYYYECLKQVVLQFKEHLKTGRGISNKNNTKKHKRKTRKQRRKEYREKIENKIITRANRQHRRRNHSRK
jgi:Trp operon repressor